MKINIAILLIVLVSFAVCIYFYPQMPEAMVSHWNAQGNPDGYMPKFWGLFMVPFITIVMAVFFLLIPKIDPLKSNIEKFRNYFDNFVLLIVLFMFYIHALTIFWNLGIKFNLIQFLVPALGILFYYCGILVEKAKRNFFIGIRTPWTLSSDSVWDKTHKLGGKLFKAAGVVALLGIFIQKYAFFIFLFSIIFASVYSVVYSYFEYRKERFKQNSNASFDK